MINEEEKKAIKILGTFEFRQKTMNYNKIDLEDVESTKIVLNLITKLQKENKEKAEQIDLMAEYTFNNNKAQLIIEYGIEDKEQFIEKFEKLAKEKE